MLDRFGPTVLAPDELRVAGAEPRCRVDVFTWVRSGRVTARASRGPLAEAAVGPGDWLWLRSGDGVVSDLAADGVLDAVQLWVDVPRRAQRGEGALHVLRTDAIPVVALGEDGSRVRVVAGAVGDAVGPLGPSADVAILHVFLAKGAAWTHVVPGAARVVALVIDGFGQMGVPGATRPAKAGDLVRFDADGTSVRMAATPEAALELLLIAGRPLRQPVARFGPFIASDEASIKAAMYRFQRGRFGTLAPRR